MSENAPRFTHAEIKMMLLALDDFEKSLEQVYSKEPHKELEERHRLVALQKKLDAELGLPDATPEAPEPEWFKNRLEAYQWLQEHGLKMGQTTFYENIGKPGFPRLLRGKRLSREECEFLLWQESRKGGVRYVGYGSEILAWRKALSKTHIAELNAKCEAERMERENSLEWIKREDAYYRLKGAMVAFLMAAIDKICNQVPALIRKVEGDESRASDVCKELEWELFTAYFKTEKTAKEDFYLYEDEPPFAPHPD